MQWRKTLSCVLSCSSADSCIRCSAVIPPLWKLGFWSIEWCQFFWFHKQTGPGVSHGVIIPLKNEWYVSAKRIRLFLIECYVWSLSLPCLLPPWLNTFGIIAASLEYLLTPWMWGGWSPSASSVDSVPHHCATKVSPVKTEVINSPRSH